MLRLKREEAILRIARQEAEVQELQEVLIHGCKGLETLSNEELSKELEVLEDIEYVQII